MAQKPTSSFARERILGLLPRKHCSGRPFGAAAGLAAHETPKRSSKLPGHQVLSKPEEPAHTGGFLGAHPAETCAGRLYASIPEPSMRSNGVFHRRSMSIVALTSRGPRGRNGCRRSALALAAPHIDHTARRAGLRRGLVRGPPERRDPPLLRRRAPIGGRPSNR